MPPIPYSCPELIAREPNSILLESGLIDQHNRFSYLFREPAAIVSAQEPGELEEMFQKAEWYLAAGFHLAGLLSYECGYWFQNQAGLLSNAQDPIPLAWFGVYRAPLVFDHNEAESNQYQRQSATPASHPKRRSTVGSISNLRVELDRAEYLKRVRKIRQYITDGDTYQVNFTTRAHFDFQGEPQMLYGELLERQHASYCAFLHIDDQFVLSLSPELFFRIDRGSITARPMKGTAPRGATDAEDELIHDWLREDEKNRSENIMIVDLVRSDLGRLAVTGSVKVTELFAIEAYETLFQMTSTITGQLRRPQNWRGIFEALFPSGSVTGAPKLRTMEIIQELEPSPRGVYTGAIGFIRPDGNAVFNVPIRTITLNRGKGIVGVGSGITFDSVAEQEYEECLLKLRFLGSPNTISR